MRIFADVPVKSRVRQLCGRMRQPAKVESAGEASSTVGLVTELHLATTGGFAGRCLKEERGSRGVCELS